MERVAKRSFGDGDENNPEIEKMNEGTRMSESNEQLSLAKLQPEAHDLNAWLVIATRGLCSDAKHRVRDEVQAHVAMACAQADGEDDEKVRRAIATLGQAKSANRRYKRVYVTEKEERRLARFNRTGWGSAGWVPLIALWFITLFLMLTRAGAWLFEGRVIPSANLWQMLFLLSLAVFATVTRLCRGHFRTQILASIIFTVCMVVTQSGMLIAAKWIDFANGSWRNLVVLLLPLFLYSLFREMRLLSKLRDNRKTSEK